MALLQNADILMGSRLTFSNFAPLQIRPGQVDDALQDGTSCHHLNQSIRPVLVHAYAPGKLDTRFCLL